MRTVSEWSYRGRRCISLAVCSFLSDTTVTWLSFVFWQAQVMTTTAANSMRFVIFMLYFSSFFLISLQK